MLENKFAVPACLPGWQPSTTGQACGLVEHDLVASPGNFLADDA
jgi:hypothetical protein